MWHVRSEDSFSELVLSFCCVGPSLQPQERIPPPFLYVYLQLPKVFDSFSIYPGRPRGMDPHLSSKTATQSPNMLVCLIVCSFVYETGSQHSVSQSGLELRTQMILVNLVPQFLRHRIRACPTPLLSAVPITSPFFERPTSVFCHHYNFVACYQ